MLRKKNWENDRKETIVLSELMILIGIFGIVVSLDLYSTVLPEAIPINLGVSCIPLIGGGIFAILSSFNKWVLHKSLKQKRNGLIMYSVNAIVFTILTILIYSYSGYSSSLFGFLIMYFLYPVLNWVISSFYLWIYLREKYSRIQK